MTWAEQAGGGIELSFGVDTTIYPWSAKCFTATATTTSLRLKVPNVTSPYWKDGLQFLLWNPGANTYTLCKHDNTVLATLTTGSICRLTSLRGNLKAKLL